MDLGPLRALALDLNFEAHAVDGSLSGEHYPDPIDTRVIWLQPVNDGMPTGSLLVKTTPIRIAALRRSEVATAPAIGDVLIAPETSGGTNRSWRVDGHERTEADHWRVYVVLDGEADALVHE